MRHIVLVRVNGTIDKPKSDALKDGYPFQMRNIKIRKLNVDYENIVHVWLYVYITLASDWSRRLYLQIILGQDGCSLIKHRMGMKIMDM